jgi:carbohydrate diacid regulator
LIPSRCERVGAVGITGPLIEVRPLADIVRTSVLLVLAQRQAMEFQEAVRGRLESLIDAMSEGVSGPRGGEAVALPDLSSPKSAVLVDTGAAELELLGQEAFVVSAGHFLIEPEQLRAVLGNWCRRFPQATFYVSETKDLVRDAVLQVDQLLSICRLLRLRGQVHDAARLAHLRALVGVRVPARLRALDRYPELEETLRVFVARNQSVNEAAAELHLHRNTLIYRLNRVRVLTGYDPREAIDLLALIGYLLRAASPIPGLPTTG